MSSTRDNKKGRAKQSTVNELKLLQRRQKVASLYLEGIPQHVIQEMLHIGYTTVIRDLKAIRVYWLSVMAADFNEAKSTELAKIDHLEATAWKAWKRSTRPAHTRHTSVE